MDFDVESMANRRRYVHWEKIFFLLLLHSIRGDHDKKHIFSFQCYYVHYTAIMKNNISLLLLRPVRRDYSKKKFFYCYYAHYAVIMTKKCIFSFQYFVCYTVTMIKIFCLIATTSITPSLCQNKRTFIATTFTTL